MHVYDTALPRAAASDAEKLSPGPRLPDGSLAPYTVPHNTAVLRHSLTLNEPQLGADGAEGKQRLVSEM